jgi:iron complex outermembrane receptor protein
MRYLSLFASSAMAATIAAGAAHAQAGGATTTIEELVVTAEKREQNLQDVPVAISAFTSKQRDLVGINTIQDLTNFTPGFVYNSYNDRASLRGIGRLSNVHAVDGAVAIYIDGLFTTSSVLAGAPPLETDRVEILRGPQGTLYGRNAIGGTINIVSARPTDHPYAEVRAIAENYGFTDFQAAASGPLTDNLDFRISGYKRNQRDGYYTNVNPGQPSEGNVRDEYEYQVQLKAKLGENADWWMSYRTLNWNNSGGPGARAGYLNASYETGITDQNFPVVFNSAHGYSTDTGVNGIVPGSLVQFGAGNTTVNPALSDAHKFNTNAQTRDKLTDVNLFTTNFTYHLDNIDIKYVGGLQQYKYDLYGDTDGTNVKSFQIPLAPGSICGTVHTIFSLGGSTVDCGPQTVNADNRYHYFEYPKWYSHEINLASTGNGPLQWIVGAFYYNEQYSATGNTADFYINGTSSLQTPILGAAANPAGTWSTGHYNLTTESTAAFGQLDWKPTETLKFTLGLRYTKDHKHGTEYSRILCNSDVCYTGLYPAIGLSGFGPGTASNWGSLLGNLAALPAVGKAIGLGNALAPLGGLGNGAMDLTTVLAPTTTSTGAKGVTSPVVCSTPTHCIQYTIDPATGVAARNLGDSSDAVTGTLGVQWDPSEGSMYYARYSRGYKAFGLSAGSFLAAPEARPEFVNSYEVGFKKSFGRTLQVDAAIYYLDYTNLQAPVSVLVGAPGGPQTTANAFLNIAQSRSEGVELDVIWQPIQPLRFSLDYSYDDTRIEKSDKLVDLNDNLTVNAAGVKQAVSIVGNSLPQAPKNKVAVNGTYSFFTDAGTLSLGATYVYRDKAYSNVFSRAYNESPSWDQVDLRAVWVPTSNKYTVIGYVKNATDTQGHDSATTAAYRNFNPSVASDQFASGAQTLFLNPPRTYGIELQYRFF